MSDLLRPFAPRPDRPFDLRLAGHLARRVGFGADLPTRLAWVRQGVPAALAAVLEPGRGDDVDALLPEVLATNDIERVRAYRVWRALAGRHRLAEHVALFWHGHFATGNQKVQSARLMARQLALFDTAGLGRFDDLLQAVSHDPAMLRWLDAERNVKSRPNENFARELFELFALGIGRYGERDVQEAARAFTGWREQRETFVHLAALHDHGDKEVLGTSGAWTGEDVVAMAAQAPASARFLARKWLAAFVHPTPTAEEITAVAAEYTRQDRHVGRTLRTLLSSELFFSARAYRSKVKGPVDFVVGMVRSVGGRAAPAALARAVSRLGQVLLEPPSVEGWHRERAWLNSATWLGRANFAAALFAGRDGTKLQPNADAILADATDPAARAQRAIDLLLDGDASPASRRQLEDFAHHAADGARPCAAILHATACLPEAQLQ